MNGILSNPYLLVIALLTLANIILLSLLFWRFLRYQKRLTELFSGNSMGNLDEVLAKQHKSIQNHSKNLKELGEILGEIVEQNKVHVQHIGVVRFNPFGDTGGNLSFSVALLDALQNGIVISSLHSREGTRIYAKALKFGKSESNLTDEEQSAIDQAKQIKTANY